MNVKETIVIMLALLVMNGTISQDEANNLIKLADQKMTGYNLPSTVNGALALLRGEA